MMKKIFDNASSMFTTMVEGGLKTIPCVIVMWAILSWFFGIILTIVEKED